MFDATQVSAGQNSALPPFMTAAASGTYLGAAMTRGIDESLPAARMTDGARFRAFVFAGRAIFTIVSGRTGTRYTFRVSASKKYPGTHRVDLLAGPSNTSDFSYAGYVEADRRTYKAPRRACDAVKALQWLFHFLAVGDDAWSRVVAGQTEVWHEGRCGRCGRRLTVPQSIATGLGPECAARQD